MSSHVTTDHASLAEAREKLVTHPLYSAVKTRADVAIFMRHHVFAVWDFFTLLKRLQAEVTCVTIPWQPRGMAEHGRFVMEIVIGEETDEDIGGGFISHFELYRRAMMELGADDRPIAGYLSRLTAGQDPVDALNANDIPDTGRSFVGHTLAVALHAPPHEVAASFCHGRENLLPDVLAPLRDNIGGALAEAPVFAHYLDRHITLDHDEHGPLALKLLSALCHDDPKLEADAERVGIAAIEARITLWDGILAEIEG
jgi:hypothetical protein